MSSAFNIPAGPLTLGQLNRLDDEANSLARLLRAPKVGCDFDRIIDACNELRYACKAVPPVDAVPGEPVNPGDDPYPAEVWILPRAKDHENLRLSAVVDGPGPHGFMNPADPKKMAVRYVLAASMASRAGSEPVACDFDRLQGAIMNLREPRTEIHSGIAASVAYKLGCRDIRHAATALVGEFAASIAPAAAAEPSERFECPECGSRSFNEVSNGIRECLGCAADYIVTPDRAGVASLVVAPEAAVLLEMFLSDVDICIGECGRHYKFKELSEETVKAAIRFMLEQPQ